MTDTDQAEFRKQIRDALIHLYDTAHLECHMLVPQLLEPNASSRLTRAQMLRGLLKEGIETLRPQDGSPQGAPEWRSYLALHYRYVKGLTPLEIQDELGLSRRQLQREERKGIDALAAMLWEHRSSRTPPDLSTTEKPGDVQVLLRELDRWEINRQACALQTLVDDTCWMLQPLLDRTGAALQVALPSSLAPVFVDPTLTRQALLRVLRLLINQAGQGVVSLHATSKPGVVDVLISAETLDLNPETEDWEIARLLVGRQGGTLRHETRQSTDDVVMRLPLASRARVLVIDDTEAIHRLFERYLAPHNYEVIGASSGAEALRLARERHPDLITLDVMMPTMDGWQILRDLRDSPTTAGTPVVICSVLAEPELALSLGARAFIKKPVGRLELLNALEQIRGATPLAEEAHQEVTADR